MAITDFFNNLFIRKGSSNIDFIEKSINSYIATQNSLPEGKKRDISIPEVTKELCYNMANYNDTLRNVLHIINRETFKSGFKIIPKFVRKCEVCGEEYQNAVKECCNQKTSEPNNLEYDVLNSKLNDINRNGQSIIDVLRQIELDLNIVDEGYIFVDIENSIYRIDPLTITPIINNQGLLGHRDRNMLVYTPSDRRKTKLLSSTENIPDGYKTADYESKDGLFFSRTELFRLNKFSENLAESVPPVMTLWNKLYILQKMDDYLTSWYAGRRSSKGILVFNTNNYQDMAKQLEKQMELIQKNPQYLMNIITETKDAKKLIEYIPLSPNPSELDSEDTRDSLRRYVAGFYGVLPLYLGDVTNTGGLNNETQQLTITRDAIIGNINRYNKILENIVKRLEINDWLVKLELPDEIEIPRKQALEKGKLEIARMKYELGYNVEYDKEIDDWVIKDKRDTDIQGLDFGFD